MQEKGEALPPITRDVPELRGSRLGVGGEQLPQFVNLRLGSLFSSKIPIKKFSLLKKVRSKFQNLNSSWWVEI